METRRLIIAIVAAFGVYLAYMTIYGWLKPATPPPPQDTSLPEALRDTGKEPTPAPAPATGPATTQEAGTFSFTSGTNDKAVVLPGRTLQVELTPRGAGLLRLLLTEKKKDGEYVHRAGPRSNEPYELLQPVNAPAGLAPSFTTHRIWIEQRENENWRLDDLLWEDGGANTSRPQSQAGEPWLEFTTTLRERDGAGELLRLTKRYTLLDTPLLMRVEFGVENLSDQPLTVVVAQDGPTGIRREGVQYEMRRLLGASRKDGELVIQNLQKPAIKKAQDAGTPLKISDADPNATFLWGALLNKFFGVFVRPLPVEGRGQIQAGNALVDVPDDSNPGDLRARFFTSKIAIQPRSTVSLPFEVYAGPRDPDVLKVSNPEFVDQAKLGYTIAAEADQTCCFCTFEPLPTAMSWLLRGIHALVFNYGVAIIIMVIIVRTILHPLAVFQQKSMYRMQESMARVQPKLAVLKQKFGNDKMKLNQEMMKLWAEENVNPAAGLVSFIPLFLQMPILVALWTAMSTEIQLRNAPFDGWWIVDLSAPDALISFGEPGITIPILGWLPFIGWIFQNITSFNLLPVLMGVSMWLQQKYMPKPQMPARIEAAKTQQSGEKPAGMTVEDQIRQQQLAGNIMSVMFPFMFYYMPAGLNLYWMATNIFGIIESLIIRRQLAHEKERRGTLLPTRKGPGRFGKMFKWIAEQGEQLQKQADTVTEQDKRKHTQKERDSRKKR